MAFAPRACEGRKPFEAWIASAVLLTMVGQGMLFGFPSSLLPALRESDSPIKADLHTASWLASSVGVSGIPGFFLSSFVMVYWGRRIAHITALVPGILGWTLIFFASDNTALMMGRILGGVTAGASVCLGAMILGEFTSPTNRGMFLNLKTTSVCLGSMIVHILGNYLTWRTISLLALIPHVLALLIILTWPESPAWLASRNEFDKAEKAFFWLRGQNEDTVRELKELINAQVDQKLKSEKESSLIEDIVNFFNKFTRKDFLKPMWIIFLGAILIEVSGRHWFPAYALDIIGEITGNKSKSFYYTLGLDMVITVSATFSSILVKLVKRRVLLFTTGSAALVVLTIVCIYLLLVSKGVIYGQYPWIPITLLVVYFILANLGCTPIPLAFLGEMVPLAHKGAGSAVAGIIFSSVLQSGLQITPYLLASVKVYGTFTVLGSITGACLLILYFTVPETKDRTLQEIEDYFVYGKFRDDCNKIDEETEVKMLDKNEPMNITNNEDTM